jgi:hypothetical protein
MGLLAGAQMAAHMLQLTGGMICAIDARLADNGHR